MHTRLLAEQFSELTALTRRRNLSLSRPSRRDADLVVSEYPRSSTDTPEIRSRAPDHSKPVNPRAVERLEGSLRALLDGYLSRGRQPPLEQALRWLAQTAAGLAECTYT